MKTINKIKADSFKHLLVHEGVNTCGDALGSVQQAGSPTSGPQSAVSAGNYSHQEKKHRLAPYRVLQ